jgi:hypothetical protein
LVKHVEWALVDLMKNDLNLIWKDQNIAPMTMSTELTWLGPIGLGSRLVSILSKWPKIRLEVFQDRFNEHPAERYALSPNLGIYRAELNALGETIITENKLKAALERSRIENEPFEVELAFLIGTPWDEDLEPFRRTTEDGKLKWISKTG